MLSSQHCNRPSKISGMAGAPAFQYLDKKGIFMLPRDNAKNRYIVSVSTMNIYLYTVSYKSIHIHEYSWVKVKVKVLPITGHEGPEVG